MNKAIQRDAKAANIFNERSLQHDYKTLVPLLKKGMQVLDVGCGTGAISKDIALFVGAGGSVTGIDNTKTFIADGCERYGSLSNLKLLQADLFEFEPSQKFDLVISARTLQWLRNPKEAIAKMKSWVKPGGYLSVLDYNHDALVWKPAPPPAMQMFYAAFLNWRAKAGMNNSMAAALPNLFNKAGLQAVEVFAAHEEYKKGMANFAAKLSIWSTVAASTQLVEEGFITNEARLDAIDQYNKWIEQEAELMILNLAEVRGKVA